MNKTSSSILITASTAAFLMSTALPAQATEEDSELDFLEDNRRLIESNSHNTSSATIQENKTEEYSEEDFLEESLDTVEPFLTINDEITAGEWSTVSAQGFGENETVDIELLFSDGTLLSLGSVETDEYGEFTTEILIPHSVENGAKVIILIGTESEITITQEIIVINETEEEIPDDNDTSDTTGNNENIQDSETQENQNSVDDSNTSENTNTEYLDEEENSTIQQDDNQQEQQGSNNQQGNENQQNDMIERPEPENQPNSAIENNEDDTIDSNDENIEDNVIEEAVIDDDNEETLNTIDSNNISSPSFDYETNPNSKIIAAGFTNRIGDFHPAALLGLLTGATLIASSVFISRKKFQRQH